MAGDLTPHHPATPAGWRGQRTRAVVAGLTTLLAAGSLVLFPVSAGAAVGTGATSRGPLAKVGPAAKLPAGASVTGAAPAGQEIHIAVGLTPNDPAGLQALAGALSDPGSVQQGRYLTKGQFAARFGAPTAEIGSVKAALADAGLDVTGVSSDGLLLDASGTVSQVDSAFHTTIDDVRLPGGRTGFADTSAPEVATSVAHEVIGVAGLSDVARAVPLYERAGHRDKSGSSSHAATPGATPADQTQKAPDTGGPTECTAENAQQAKLEKTNTLSPVGWTAVADTYGFNTAYKSDDFGQTVPVGILELSPYSSSDLTAFERCVLATYAGPIGSVSNVPIDGGAGAGAGTLEPILDVEDVRALAPATDIVMYEAPNNTLGVVDDYDTMVATDQVQVISTSWGQCEPLDDPVVESIENLIFQEAAVQGQTVFSAAGDTGSTDCHLHTTTATPTTTLPRTPTRTTQLAVDDPASQPYVTGVGGTTLTEATATGTLTPAESAWGTARRKIGGGGGVSERWAKPAWQTTGRPTATVPAPATPTGTCSTTPTAPVTATSTSCRQVPDVVANANPTVGGDMIYCKEQGTYCTTKKTSLTGWEDIGGTSQAAPEWAALAALADASCQESIGFINPRLYALGSGTGTIPVTTGTNDVTGVHPGHYTASTGYNNVTGLGAPTGGRLLSGTLCPSVVHSRAATVAPTTAGAPARYVVDIKAGPALAAGDSVTLAAQAGTGFPADPADYTVNGVRPTTVSPTFTGTSPTFNAVVVTLSQSIPAATPLTVEVVGVVNPGTVGPDRIYATTTYGATTYFTFPITAGAPSPGASTVTAADPSVAANGTHDRVKVTVTDTFGNPVKSAAVTLAATTAAASAVSGTGPGTTNAQGVAAFTVSSTTPVSATFSATLTVSGTATPVARTAKVDFSDLSITSVSSTDPQAGVLTTLDVHVTTPASSGTTVTLTAPAGATLPPSVSDYHLVDGATVPVHSVTVAAGAGSGTTNQAAIVLGNPAPTGTLDLSVSTVRNPTTAGTGSVSVATAADPVAADATTTVHPGTVDAATSSVVPNYPSDPSDGLSVDLVTITARDRYGNPVATLPVDVTVNGQADATPSSTVTSTTGVAYVGVTDPTAQLSNVTVTSPQGAVGSTTISFSGISALNYQVVTSLTAFVADDTTGATVAIEALAELSGGVHPGGWVVLTAPAGTQLPATAGDYALLDTFSKPQAATVSLSKGPGSSTTNVATFTLAKTATGLSNKASFAIVLVVTARNPAHPVSGRASIAASGTSNGVPSYSPAVTFTVGPVSPTHSGITVVPPVAAVGTSASATVTVLDADTNPIVGQTVTLLASGGATVTPPAATTGADGSAVFSVSDDSTGTVTLSATVTGVVLTGSVRFANGSSVAGVTVSPTSVPAGGSSTYTVGFTTSATGALAASATISIVGAAGTTWPATTASYRITGQLPAAVSGTGSAAHPLVLTLGHAGAADSSAVTVTATHVLNPPQPSTGDALAVSTSADITPVLSNPYSVVAVAETGYDLVGGDGGVFVFNAPGSSGGFFGSLPQLGITPVAPIVGMVSTASDDGYFLVGADGGVFAFGDAPYLGSSHQINPALAPGGTNSFVPSAPIVGIVTTSTDHGYFLVGADGGVFAFGDAPYLGSLPGRGIVTGDVVGIAATPSGDGYWVITATGTVYAFGAAQTLGPATGLGSPVAAIAGTPTGAGYWVAAEDGAVRAFGDATDFGTLPGLHVAPNLPVVGIVPIDGTGGYWLIGETGGIYAFGHAPFIGSLPGLGKVVSDIVGAVPN